MLMPRSVLNHANTTATSIPAPTFQAAAFADAAEASIVPFTQGVVPSTTAPSPSAKTAGVGKAVHGIILVSRRCLGMVFWLPYKPSRANQYVCGTFNIGYQGMLCFISCVFGDGGSSTSYRLEVCLLASGSKLILKAGHEDGSLLEGRVAGFSSSDETYRIRSLF